MKEYRIIEYGDGTFQAQVKIFTYDLFLLWIKEKVQWDDIGERGDSIAYAQTAIIKDREFWDKVKSHNTEVKIHEVK